MLPTLHGDEQFSVVGRAALIERALSDDERAAPTRLSAAVR